jgi:putative transposase
MVWGRPAVVASNGPDRQFTVDAPEKAQMTNITDIKTHQGRQNVAVVIDLYSNRVVRRSAQPRNPA